jgi:ribose 5-phosphate isomerase B
MKVYLASDHAGFALKEIIKTYLIEKGYEVIDCGAFTLNKDDDYPDFVAKAAQVVSKDPSTRAIIFGSSGQGEAVTANKFKNVRAVIFYTPITPIRNVDITGRTSQDSFEMVCLTRLHNDSNILSLGAAFITEVDAKRAIDLWLETPFSNEERHRRRINKISEIESKL